MQLTSIEQVTEFAAANADGKDWYVHAHRTLRALFGHATPHVAGIVAVTSPKCPVWVNVVRTFAVLEHGVEGITRPGTARSSSGIISALNHYLSTGEIRGPKTSAFAANLSGDLSKVTIDVHMYWAFGYSARASVKARREIESMVIEAAKVLGWEPAEVQAAIWAGVIRAKGRTDVPCIANLMREYARTVKA